MHVTETVASYSVLRKTVDHFSHGSAGWQGLVTERTAHQPKLNLALTETTGQGAWSCLVVIYVPAVRAPLTLAGRKGTAALLFSPLPPLITNTRFPGACEFLKF